MAEPRYQPPVCRHLRTKGYYIHGNRPETWDPTCTSAPSIWCLHTMTFRGPDGEEVGLLDCREGRSCYEVWVDEEQP